MFIASQFILALILASIFLTKRLEPHKFHFASVSLGKQLFSTSTKTVCVFSTNYNQHENVGSYVWHVYTSLVTWISNLPSGQISREIYWLSHNLDGYNISIIQIMSLRKYDKSWKYCKKRTQEKNTANWSKRHSTTMVQESLPNYSFLGFTLIWHLLDSYVQSDISDYKLDDSQIRFPHL